MKGIFGHSLPKITSLHLFLSIYFLIKWVRLFHLYLSFILFFVILLSCCGVWFCVVLLIRCFVFCLIALRVDDSDRQKIFDQIMVVNM